MKYIIILVIFAFSHGIMAQDTIHVKGQYVLSSSFNIAGQFVTGGDDEVPKDNRFSLQLRLRAHKFIWKKFATGIGINYYDYYFSHNPDNLDLKKPFNGEAYIRYYPFRKMYLEPSVMYGGYARDTLTILENTNHFVGGFSLGFETRIKSRFFLELDIKTYFDVSDKTRFGGFGTTGSLFLGVNYYINQDRKNGARNR